MAPRRFTTMLAIVSTIATAALLLGMRAARDGGTALSIGAVVAGALAVIGILLLARVMVVVERARSRR